MNPQEHQIAQKISRLLDQSARDIPGDTLAKLAAAREQALAGYREIPAWSLAGAGQMVSRLAGQAPGGMRYVYVIPTAVLILGLIGIIYWQTSNGRGNELADIDARLLADDLPIDAYLDKGFDSWLKRQSR